MLIADTKLETGPIDPFKTVYHPNTKKGNVSEKINHVTHYSMG